MGGPVTAAPKSTPTAANSDPTPVDTHPILSHSNTVLHRTRPWSWVSRKKGLLPFWTLFVSSFSGTVGGGKFARMYTDPRKTAKNGSYCNHSHYGTVGGGKFARMYVGHRDGRLAVPSRGMK